MREMNETPDAGATIEEMAAERQTAAGSGTSSASTVDCPCITARECVLPVARRWRRWTKTSERLSAAGHILRHGLSPVD